MRRLRLFEIAVLLSAPLAVRGASRVEVLGDASITHLPASGTWTIAAGGAALTLGLDPSRDFQIVSLVSPMGRNWMVDPMPGTTLTVRDTAIGMGSRAAGVRFDGVKTSIDGHALRLDAALTLQPAQLRVIYKTLRLVLSAASGVLLREPAAVNSGPPWDVLPASTSINIRPTGLQPDAAYLVQSVDTGSLGTATGADLAADGIDIVASPYSAAHILTLVRDSQTPRVTVGRQR